jgi:hypothetical protein
MYELYAWIRVAWRLIRYLGYRMGLGECPTLLDVYPEAVVVFDRVMGWPRTLFVKGGEHCSPAGPVVYAGNHAKKDDPFVMYRAVNRVTGWSCDIRYMMRNDFFKAIPNLRIIDVDELLRMLGAQQISRDNVQLSQLKPFVKLLREGNGFIMYPGRSRSRSGLFMEYRDGIDEPGGVTFFLAQAQRGRPDSHVPAVPVARSYNPVTKRSVVIFGPPVYLPHDADRAAQRDMDFHLVEQMGELIEINVAMAVSALLYLHCLHDRPSPIDQGALVEAVRAALHACAERRHVDESAVSDLPREVKMTLEYLGECGMLELRGTLIRPNKGIILASPELDTAYVKKNPVKHLVNQTLHLADVTAAFEAAAQRL